MRARVTLVLLVAAVVGAFLFWRQRRTTHAEVVAPPRAAQPGSSHVASSPTPSAPSKVRRISTEDRAELAAQIRRSLARRAQSGAAPGPMGAAGSTNAPVVDVPLLELKDVGPELKAALDESIPILADCYEAHPGHTIAPSGSDHARTALAMMTMTTDPDLGTIIDSDTLTDEDGTPLDSSIEACLRETIQTLALPPLGKPGRLPLQYSFRFD